MDRQLLLAISVSFGLLSAEGFLHQYPKLDLSGKIDDDCANPLILTHYIESGDIAEGRRLARVPFTEKLNITSFAGFFTVDKTYDSHQFFWYFPAMSNAKQAPVILWLPGQFYSSLFGLFIENGPLTVEHYTLDKREHHWALDHHVIYIDNPVGAGFSFSNNDAGYCKDQTQIGQQLYSSIVQFFQIFPELKANRFYITGEAEAGMYAPALAHTIHKNNPTAVLKINLKGLAISSGWSDPENQLGYGDYLNQLGFIDWNVKKQFKQTEKDIKAFIQEHEWLYAHDCFQSLSGTYLLSVGYESFYNYNQIGNDTFAVGPIMSSSVIRKGLHVGHLPFYNHDLIGEDLLYVLVMQSMAPIISELLDHYDVLTYNGQLDAFMGYPRTVNYLRHLNFTGSEEYETAKRHIWRVDGEVAGYVKTAGRLVEALVRNAGYMISKDQPKWALDLITRFTHGKPFYGPNY